MSGAESRPDVDGFPEERGCRWSDAHSHICAAFLSPPPSVPPQVTHRASEGRVQTRTMRYTETTGQKQVPECVDDIVLVVL